MNKRQAILIITLGYSRKNPNRGVRTWNFQGYSTKSMWKFQGSIKKRIKRRGISRGVQEKLIWNFHGFWCFDLGVSKRCHKILQNYQG